MAHRSSSRNREARRRQREHRRRQSDGRLLANFAFAPGYAFTTTARDRVNSVFWGQSRPYASAMADPGPYVAPRYTPSCFDGMGATWGSQVALDVAGKTLVVWQATQQLMRRMTEYLIHQFEFSLWDLLSVVREKGYGFSLLLAGQSISKT